MLDIIILAKKQVRDGSENKFSVTGRSFFSGLILAGGFLGELTIQK